MKPTFDLFGVTFSSYGVMCALGIVFSLCLALFRTKKASLRTEYAFVTFTFALAFGLAGAFFTHMIVSYSIQDLLSLLSRGAFFEEYSPGFVYYGGFIFGALGAYLASKVLHFHLLDYSASLIPALPLAHAFGRVGCFLAGCCYGIECPFGVIYPPNSSAPAYISLFPVQLLESALLIAICVFLCLYLKKGTKNALRAYVLMYAPTRFFIEFLRGDMHRGIFLHLSTAQWTSLILLLLIFLPVKNLRRG